MKQNRLALSLLALGVIAVAAPPARAQGERSNRLDPHPVRQIVGIVSRVLTNDAWVAFAQPVKVGAKISVSAFSDGGDTLFVGTVKWASAVAPFEAYITDVHSVTTKHDLNEFQDYYTLGAATRRQREYGSQPETIGDGMFFTAGYFVRADIADTQKPAGENVESVRGNIAALRAQNSRIASAIADAAEKALGLDPLVPASEQVADYAVNYSALIVNLRAFQRLAITDPITAKLLTRLNDLAVNSGEAGAAVPNNFFRPASESASAVPQPRPAAAPSDRKIREKGKGKREKKNTLVF